MQFHSEREGIPRNTFMGILVGATIVVALIALVVFFSTRSNEKPQTSNRPAITTIAHAVPLTTPRPGRSKADLVLGLIQVGCLMALCYDPD